MMKFTDEVETVVEPCKDGSGNWYWAVKINGELYADGEAENRMVAQIRCVTDLDEWKQKNV